jgi:beta-xylosidase
MNSSCHPAPWIPDQGDGTYCNPVIHADYSDPDAIRVGEDFYLIASSFNCTPGLPILHSRDLVNWTIINHALKNLPHPRYDDVQPGQGVWAPAIRHHGGKFWIVFPTPDEGIYVTTATDPRGDWSEPHLLLEGKGLIDPCPFWDDDGQAYIAYAYAASRAGIRNKLHVRPISPDATEVLGEGEIVASIDETLPALEGPKWHKRNGWYYLSAPSGGVQMGWQVIFRSRNVYGPYEEKIVLAQRGTPTNGPHQGALVDTPDGEWWFIHFQDVDLYGRVVHLQPVRWDDDWPLVGVDQNEEGVGKPVLVHPLPSVRKPHPAAVPQTSDEFQSDRLGLQWQWHSNHRDTWHSLVECPGKLRLFPQFVRKGDFLHAGNLLLQKFPAREFAVVTELELPAGHENLHAGLIVMGLEHAALDVQMVTDGYQVRLLINGEPRGELAAIPGASVRLGVLVANGGVCRFGIVGDDESFYQIGPAFFAKVGRWIGAKFGLYCLSPNSLNVTGRADFSYCRVSGAAPFASPGELPKSSRPHPDTSAELSAASLPGPDPLISKNQAATAASSNH